MDQLQLVLSILKKQYFWVASAAILVVALASWAKATRDAAQQYGQRKSKLQGDFQALQGITSEPNHPNKAVIAALHEKTARLSEEVFRAWQILYQDQKAKNQLSASLSQRFRDYWEAAGAEGELPRDLREHYQIFIVDHIPKLFDMIGVRRQVARQPEGSQPAAAGSAGMEGVDVDQFGAAGSQPAASARESPDVQMVGIVDWPDHEALTQRFYWQSVPSTLRVRVAQEDLWVYEALLRVIKDTNEGATTYENAAVKQINAILIGQEAIGAGPQKRRTGGPGGSRPTGPGGGGFYAPVVTGSETDVDEFGSPVALPTTAQSPSSGLGAPAGLQASADPEQAELLDGRYVDENSNPLGANQEHPYAEFKMMPIRLSLVMDQRKIRRLLGECANSSMPIEVKRVTIRAQQDRLGPGSGRGAAPGRPGGSVAGSRPPGMLAQALPATLPAAGPRAESGPWDVPVEIEGVIYIYNPPNRALLGTGAAAQEVVGGPEAQATGPEQPATPPAPPATRPGAAPAGPPGGSAVPPPGEPLPPAGPPGGSVPPAGPPPAGPTPPVPALPPGTLPGPSSGVMSGPGAPEPPAEPTPGPEGMPSGPAVPAAPPMAFPAAPPAGVPAGGAGPGAVSP